MERKVLTQDEINQLRLVRDKRVKLIESFGILVQKEILKEELKNLVQEEIQLGANLQQKYGDGSIDLEKGEFITN